MHIDWTGIATVIMSIATVVGAIAKAWNQDEKINSLTSQVGELKAETAECKEDRSTLAKAFAAFTKTGGEGQDVKTDA